MSRRSEMKELTYDPKSADDPKCVRWMLIYVVDEGPNSFTTATWQAKVCGEAQKVNFAEVTEGMRLTT
jgi:hypothetical protein